MFGVLVIGLRGASIDELVEDRLHRHLVDLGDLYGLADVLVKMWKRESGLQRLRMEHHHAT